MALKTGKWHAGQWGAGRQIVKVIWKRNGVSLSSGFTIAANRNEMEDIVNELQGIIKKPIMNPSNTGGTSGLEQGVGMVIWNDIIYR